MENECEALPGVAYPGVRDNRSTINTKTGYDDRHETSNALAVSVRCEYKLLQRLSNTVPAIIGSRRLSSREFQTDGPAAQKGRRQ